MRFGLRFFVVLVSFFLVVVLVLSGFFFFDLGGGSGLNHSSLSGRLFYLGYLDYVVDDPQPDVRGLASSPDSGFIGVNLFHPRKFQDVYLVDMGGEIIHNWSLSDTYKDIRFSEMADNDSIFVIGDMPGRGWGLAKIAWNSSIEWVSEGEYHHDMSQAKDGRLYVLGRRYRKINLGSETKRIIDNQIVVLTKDGELSREISIYDVLSDEFEIQYDYEGDIFHLNTIEVIEGDVGVAGKGDVLVCARHFKPNVMILDIKNSSMVWGWNGGEILFPHHPTFLDNGNLLVFDNGGMARNYSRILEVNPMTGETVWEYKNESSFWSYIIGGNQRLPNGNTLITESARGRVFEVTPEGKVVWEYLNPFYKKGRRTIIPRMMRYNRESFPLTKN